MFLVAFPKTQMRVFTSSFLLVFVFFVVIKLDFANAKSRKSNHYKPTAADDVPPEPKPTPKASSTSSKSASAQSSSASSNKKVFRTNFKTTL